MPPNQVPIAASPALSTSETIIRKPSPRIRPNDRKRVRMMPQMPISLAGAGVRQMRSSELCSSAKTAMNSRSNRPSMIA